MGTLTKQNQDALKLEAAIKAVMYVKDGDLVGLGTGTTATFAIHELGKKVADGMQITATSSSKNSEDLAKSLGIQVVDLGTLSSIDISIDGADEFTEQLNLIKGGGGAHFREKIMASLSKNAIVIADESKKVDRLGAFTIPIEVVPVAYQYVLDQLSLLSANSKRRTKDEQIFVTDNNNWVIDANFGLLEDPQELAKTLNQIEGILAHGLFIGLTKRVIMSSSKGIQIFE
ncbi:ribose-5-phosphate isomerase RpiA [Pedobacter sp. AW1-32]|uniref:ribose-5-phosphate isomerase RpiA n=1 Tax=Pedobacter sp. AW1-32 TaxID=3383026 RepID=UPI003FF11819